MNTKIKIWDIVLVGVIAHLAIIWFVLWMFGVKIKIV